MLATIEKNTTLPPNDPFSFQGSRAFHVTLIRPPVISTADGMNVSSLTPPLALAYLSASLKNAGFSFTNIDAIAEGIHQVKKLERNPTMEAQGLTADEIIQRIPHDTNLIAVSCMFSLEWPATRDVILRIREAFPSVPIVAGGEHISALPEFSMNDCPALDFIGLGEGDHLLVDIAERLEKDLPVSDLSAVYYREAGSIVRGGKPLSPEQNKKAGFDGAAGKRIRELDQLPWPAWDHVPIEKYLEGRMTFGRYVGITMPIVGSRGCPYKCTFCSNPTMWGGRYLTRTPKEVVDEILFYKEKYQIEAVEFYDLTPIIKKAWIVEFCEELIKRNANISWQISGGTRCEAIDEEVIVKSKQSGCKYIGFAPESGSKEVLERIKKKVDLNRMIGLIKIAKKHSVDTRCNIIIGFPEDTRPQIYKSLLFQMKLAFLGVTDSPIFDFTPYPGSELFRQLRSDGTIPKKLTDEYFESLGLNIQLKNRTRYCKAVGPSELMVYRICGMILFYGIYYLFRPRKLFGFLKNLVRYEYSNSVFEQRIFQNFQKQVKKIRHKSVLARP